MYQYKCLNCGSPYAKSNGKIVQPWVWKQETGGRVGPFCSVECSQGKSSSSPDGEPRFTLKEWERLRFVRETFDLSEDDNAASTGPGA